jgi:hypothetical protein
MLLPLKPAGIRTKAFALVLAATVAGCGGSSAPAPTTLASTCVSLAKETEAVSRHRLQAEVRGLPASGRSGEAALRSGLKLAANEDAANDRAAASQIRRLAHTPVTHAVLAQLARNEHDLLMPPAEDQALGLVSRVFDLTDAAGGCRQARRAIGG